MPMFKKRLYCFGVTVVLFLSSSSCLLQPRFGNKVEYPENPDKISGYYKTEPRSLKYCAQFSEGANPSSCQEVSTSGIPSEVSSIFSNPVILYVLDLATGEAIFASVKNNRNRTSVWVEEGDRLFYWGRDVLGTSETCTIYSLLLEEGSFSTYNESGTSAEGLPLSGQIDLRLNLATEFNGDCRGVLLAFQGCYLDANQCGGEDAAENEKLQSQVQSVFSDYVEAGILNPSDIVMLKSLAFEVQYQ